MKDGIPSMKCTVDGSDGWTLHMHVGKDADKSSPKCHNHGVLRPTQKAVAVTDVSCCR